MIPGLIARGRSLWRGVRRQVVQALIRRRRAATRP